MVSNNAVLLQYVLEHMKMTETLVKWFGRPFGLLTIYDRLRVETELSTDWRYWHLNADNVVIPDVSYVIQHISTSTCHISFRYLIIDNFPRRCDSTMHGTLDLVGQETVRR